MGFEKGKPRPANAGRKKGSKNKKRVLRVADYLAEHDINPTEKILSLIKLLEPEDELKAWQTLLSYCQPKPTEIDDSGEDDGPTGTEELVEAAKEISDDKLILIAGGKKASS